MTRWQKIETGIMALVYGSGMILVAMVIESKYDLIP